MDHTEKEIIQEKRSHRKGITQEKGLHKKGDHTGKGITQEKGSYISTTTHCHKTDELR